MITDSMVVIGGAVSKGRSISRALNAILRRLAAYVLGCGATIYSRWASSGRNHADGPSQGCAKGQATKEISERLRPPAAHGVFVDGVRVTAPEIGGAETANYVTHTRAA